MRRQFKTSLSEERLSVSDICSNDNNRTLLTKSLSNTDSMFHTRQKRRLPSILLQHKRQLHRSFWPTYRGAVEWMRERENDLNTLIGLLELYPQIIQESSLDGLWTWLHPLIHSYNISKVETVPKKMELSSHRSNTSTVKNNKKSEKPVPFISITSPSGERSETGNSAESKLVFVIGKTSPGDNFQKDLIDTVAREIESHFFTMVDIGCVSEEQRVLESCNYLKQSSVAVFVFSDASLNSTTSVRLLRLSWRYNIPVIFLRNSSFSLPKLLPEAVFEIFHDPHLPSKKNDRPSVLDSRAHSVSPNFLTGRNSHSRFNTLRSPTPKKTHRAQSGKSSKKFSTEQKSAISVRIMEGYENSLVYDESDPTSFTEQLFQKLSSYTGAMIYQQDKLDPNAESEKLPQVKIKPQRMHLRVPNSSGSVSGDDDSILGTSEYDSYDEGLDRIFDDDLENGDDIFAGGMDSGLSSPMEKETTYVVYPSLDYSEPADAPKVVRWPPKNNDIGHREIDAFSPFFDSPFGFEEVNLSIVVDSDSP